MLFVGHDWAEDHHDIAVIDSDGKRLATAKLPEGASGVSRLVGLLAELGVGVDEVVVGTETDRGLFVGALVAGGAEVYAVNPKIAERYRDRLRTSKVKSDALDALVLAEMVRTDRHLHRRVAADSAEVEGLKAFTRGHKDLIWRRQQFANQLRSALRDFYPAALEAFGTDLAHPHALAVLGAGRTPSAGRKLTARRIAGLLRRRGRQRYVDVRAAELAVALRVEELSTPEPVGEA
jgi:transposase